MRPVASFFAVIFLLQAVALATIFGSVRGVIHDPKHLPVKGAQLTLKAQGSDWTRTQLSNDRGEFNFTSVPIGKYTVTVSCNGFQQVTQAVIVESDTAPVLHFQMTLQGVSQDIDVSGSPVQATMDSITPTALLSRSDIQLTPGADRTNGMEMVTDYVPATYVTHDMLHMMGGHQVEWLIDGVPIPNTNIATNLGPQILPRDIDYLEVYSGSYDADYGDRTYGIFNVVPRNGFERDRECDIVLTAGNFWQTDDQISCGAHTDNAAYYASLNGNRSDYGLQTPIPQVVHDASNGYGGFASFIYNSHTKDQYRLVGSLRQDYYQIPIDPDPNSPGNAVYDSSGLRDAEREPDGYVTFSWLHTFSPKTVLTVSPFYHYNAADYLGGPDDTPVTSTVHQQANYLGAQTVVGTDFWKNDLQAGVYGFWQHQYDYFYNQFTGEPPNTSSGSVNGGVVAEFINDKFKVTPWLTLIAGLRETQFTAPSPTSAIPSVSENATDPRVGGSIKIPRLNWVFSGFYGYYYQAPPLSPVTGDLLELANGQNLAFAAIHGERDIQWQYGLMIPYKSWSLNAYNYETRARNWLDHSNIGESNLFWPITWSYALIQGWALTLRSPDVLHHGQFHLTYANQIAQASGPINGGLVCPTPVQSTCPLYVPPGLSPVDHDQRNTLNVGFNAILPWKSYASTNVYYGSGFTNGLYGTPQSQYPGPYLPAHTTFDLSVGKTFRENYSISITALNVANLRVQLDNSLTFGGFHWNDPRQIYGEFHYRFHY
jgi:hypothetical protein